MSTAPSSSKLSIIVSYRYYTIRFAFLSLVMKTTFSLLHFSEGYFDGVSQKAVGHYDPANSYFPHTCLKQVCGCIGATKWKFPLYDGNWPSFSTLQTAYSGRKNYSSLSTANTLCARSPHPRRASQCLYKVSDLIFKA